MTFLYPFLIAASLAATSPLDCALLLGHPSSQRVFTNADLDRMAACRAHDSGPPSAPQAVSKAVEPKASHRSSRAEPLASDGSARRGDLEADWRARWRAVDQKARKLRREAHELRVEAAESPRDPKKRVVGRRSPSILITRAEALETEARDLVAEFDDTARRRGALPGWLRPEGR